MKKIIIAIAFVACVSVSCMASATDSVACGFRRPVTWRIGADLNPAWIPATNSFLKGHNDEAKKISGCLSGDVHMDFSFSPDTREGILYKGLYQGIGVGVNSYFSHRLLGTPVSAYVYQGAPIVHLSERMWVGYEWRFGATFGWHHYDLETADFNTAVSTSVTAMLGLGVKLHYKMTDRLQLSFGVDGTHYSNGNTSLPNAGVNAIGATVGFSYILNPPAQREIEPYGNLIADADSSRWYYDILAYGAWRKRAVDLGGEPQVAPGRFGIVGLQFSPLRKLNRYVSVGPALDLQWDESAGIEPYWVEGTSGDGMKFKRPPFGKQLSVGLSAHAELTMPIFSVNAGVGYDFVNPKDEKRFYQSLALKAFLTKNLFLNVGYRLGNFNAPQNLMLGLGLRL